MKTYFDYSMLKKILYCTNGSHIAPHNDERPTYMGYYHTSGKFNYDNVSLVNDNNNLLIEGNFIVIDDKGVNGECQVKDNGIF